MSFTLHFATINTKEKKFREELERIFTLHFATINTQYKRINVTELYEFTLHFATINTLEKTIQEQTTGHLHYTLLLLIQLFILLNIYNIIFLFFCRTLIFYKK